MSKSLQLAQAIARLESSPLQREYVPREIQALAREVIAESGTDAYELRAAALDLLDWIDRADDGALFKPSPLIKRGRVDEDASNANEEHNEQIRNAIERLRTACAAVPQRERCDVWRTSERGQLCTREKGHIGPHHFV